MGEWTQLINTTGVAVAVLVALGLAFWRLGKLVARKLFGNPDANPPVPGAVDVYLAQQKGFFDSMTTHTTRQQDLCERHAEALGTIAQVLDRHDVAANHRTECVDTLMQIHTDPTVPHSTAQAIQRIEQLHAAALETCKVGREVLDLPSGERAAAICRHCDAIEAILKYGG